MRKCINNVLRAVLLCTVCGTCSLLSGCDVGSDSSDDEYAQFVFINDTDKRIQVYRDGGEEWVGTTSFQLVGRGSERTVELKNEARISYGYAVIDSGAVKTESSGNEIFFLDN